MSEKCCILIQISLQVVPNDYINKKLALDQVMAKLGIISLRSELAFKAS